MATIYSPPKSIALPELNFKEVGKYQKDCENYINELRELVKRRNNDKYVGEILRFPVADSYAEYMVASLKPVELIHIPLWDAWEFGYAHLLTAKQIKEDLERQKKLAEIFGGKK